MGGLPKVQSNWSFLHFGRKRINSGSRRLKFNLQQGSRMNFDHVVTSLAPEYTAKVQDLLLNPPKDTPYKMLKRQLTTRTSASEQWQLQQLLTVEELGDCKPTRVLRWIQQLLGKKANNIHGTIMRELFLERLPSNTCIVLAPSAARRWWRWLSTSNDDDSNLCWYHWMFGDQAKSVNHQAKSQEIPRPRALLVKHSVAYYFYPTLTLVTVSSTPVRISCILPSLVEQKNRSALALKQSTSPPITTFGIHSLTLNLGFRCVFYSVFVVADIRIPIIGTDF